MKTNLPDGFLARWRSGQFEGSSRPVVRVTVQQLDLSLYPRGKNLYSSILYNNDNAPLELPNIMSYTWERDVDTPVASCTLKALNAAPEAPGVAATRVDRPGYLTPFRGLSPSAQRWQHQPNPWLGMLIPDQIMRCWVGYGWTEGTPPELDPQMVLDGVWRIDDVDLGANGVVTVTARDIGSLLVDHIAMPPVVPAAWYPLEFSPRSYREVRTEVEGDPVEPTERWIYPAYSGDTSNDYYVAENGSVYGHRPTDAFDGRTDTYWLSISNLRRDEGYAFEWVEGKANGGVKGVRIRTVKGAYQMWVSVYANGSWQGSKTIPYDPDHPASAPNGSDISYVATKALPNNEGPHRIDFPLIQNATKVRVTLSNLQDFSDQFGGFPYRGAIRTFEIRQVEEPPEPDPQIVITKEPVFPEGPAGDVPGVFDSYSDIVKLLLGWGGWFWPNGAYNTLSDVSQQAAPIPDSPSGQGKWYDIVLGVNARGRIWGDIEDPKVASITKLGVDQFDKRPLLDGIIMVRDILGFIFYIAEDGSAGFRTPNIFDLGNWTLDFANDPRQGRQAVRTGAILTIDENVTLLDLGTKLSGRNVREKVIVSSPDSKIGGTADGFIVNPGKLRRVSGWTDVGWKSDAEAQMMADMIALRQLFTYRTASVKIAGNPAIQIDDQVRVYEEVTGEAYIHYVKGIGNNLDMSTGEWSYQLTTYWLGTDASGNWVFDPNQFSDFTQTLIEERIFTAPGFIGDDRLTLPESTEPVSADPIPQYTALIWEDLFTSGVNDNWQPVPFSDQSVQISSERAFVGSYSLRVTCESSPSDVQRVVTLDDVIILSGS